jgi:hypothetical protein
MGATPHIQFNRQSDSHLGLDTNTVLSELLRHCKPGQLMGTVLMDRVRLFSSLPLPAELDGILKRRQFADQLRRLGLTSETLSFGQTRGDLRYIA